MHTMLGRIRRAYIMEGVIIRIKTAKAAHLEKFIWAHATTGHQGLLFTGIACAGGLEDIRRRPLGW